MPYVEVDGDFANPPRPFKVGAAEIDAEAIQVEDGFLALEDARLVGDLPLDGCEELELTDCEIEGASFAGMSSIRMNRCTLRTCDLSRATIESLREVTLSGCKFIGTGFAEAWIRDATIEQSVFRYTNLRMATLERVAFVGCQLTEVDFYDSTLQHVSFAESELHQVNVDTCRFNHVDLRDATTVDLDAMSDLTGVLISEPQVMELAYRFALATGISIHQDPN